MRRRRGPPLGRALQRERRQELGNPQTARGTAELGRVLRHPRRGFQPDPGQVQHGLPDGGGDRPIGIVAVQRGFNWAVWDKEARVHAAVPGGGLVWQGLRLPRLLPQAEQDPFEVPGGQELDQERVRGQRAHPAVHLQRAQHIDNLHLPAPQRPVRPGAPAAQQDLPPHLPRPRKRSDQAGVLAVGGRLRVRGGQAVPVDPRQVRVLHAPHQRTGTELLPPLRSGDDGGGKGRRGVREEAGQAGRATAGGRQPEEPGRVQGHQAGGGGHDQGVLQLFAVLQERVRGNAGHQLQRQLLQLRGEAGLVRPAEERPVPVEEGGLLRVALR